MGLLISECTSVLSSHPQTYQNICVFQTDIFRVFQIYLLPTEGKWMRKHSVSKCWESVIMVSSGSFQDPSAERMGSLPSWNFRAFVKLETKERPLSCNALFSGKIAFCHIPGSRYCKTNRPHLWGRTPVDVVSSGCWLISIFKNNQFEGTEASRP